MADGTEVLMRVGTPCVVYREGTDLAGLGHKSSQAQPGRSKGLIIGTCARGNGPGVRAIFTAPKDLF